jgi:hypothetical protein
MSKPLSPILQASADEQHARMSALPVDPARSMSAYQPAPFPKAPNPVEESFARIAREDATSVGDYIGSAFRQDSFIDGLIGHYVGTQMAPQEGYSPFLDPQLEEARKAIPEEFLTDLYDTVSPAHFQYTLGRIQDKMTDLERLGDLGWAGNAGRFALGILDPANLATAYTGGLVYKGVQAARVARATAAMRAAQGAGPAAGIRATAEALRTTTQAPSVIAGATVAAAEGAAFERIRQNVNFEDSYAEVLNAALFSAALSAPLIAAGTKAQRRLAAAAEKERQALLDLADAADGKALTPEQQARVVDTFEKIDVIRAIEAGEVPHVEMDFDYLVRNGFIDPDENITLGGAATAARVTTDAPRPQSVDGLDLVDEFFPEEITAAPAPAPDKPLSTRGITVEEAPTVDAEPVPAGFLARGSIGSGAREGVESVADQKTFARGATFKLRGKEYEIPTRLDYFALLNKSELATVRRAAFDLIKDPVQVDGSEAQGVTASEYKTILRRTLMGNFLMEGRQAWKEAIEARGVPLWNRMAFAREFHEMVTKVTRGDRAVLEANPDIAAALTKASNAQRKMYADFLEEAKKAGVDGADKVKPDDFYVNRVWRNDRIREIEAKHGKDAVVKLIAAAVKDPKLRGDLEAARKFLDTIKALEYSPVMRDIALKGRDMAYLRSELDKAGIRGDRAEEIISTLLEPDPRSDAGQAPNLRFRWDLDETLDATTAPGQPKLSDLFENDARVLADIYSSSMAGYIGLAKVGIRSSQDWAKRLADVREEATAKGSLRAAKEMQYLEDIYAHITGRPMSNHTFHPLARTANALRGYTRGVMLGQLGLLSAFELRHAFALATARAVFNGSPTLVGMIRALKHGFVPDNRLADDIRRFTGAGNEIAMAYARANEVGDFTADLGEGVLSTFERFANATSHTADVVSGNRNITSATRNIAGAWMAQKHFDWATGKKDLSDADRTRMVGQGVSKDDLDDVLAALKDHAIHDTDGVLKGIDFESWKRERPESHDKYQLMLTREVRDAIQDHDLGETMPFMHTELGKVIAELRTFFLVAHAKNFLKNLSYRDQRAFQVWAVSYVGEMVNYALQTSMNYGHNPKELEERLSLENVAKAGFARASALGLTPFFVGTGYEMATGESFTRPGMTANTDSRNFFRTPSMIVAGRMGSLVQTGADAIGGRTITKQQARDAMTWLPLSNTYGARSVVDAVSNMQPVRKPQLIAD